MPGPEPQIPVAPARPTVAVNPSGKRGALRTVAEALTRAHPALGVRILVQDDIAESNVLVRGPNVSIESDAGSKALLWKCPPKSPPDSKLLVVGNAGNFRLKGFKLHGDRRAVALVNFYGRCPGATLEDLSLEGFQKYGLWVTNCEGGPSFDQHVSFLGLNFLTSDVKQAAIFFDVLPSIRDIPQNRYITMRECSFEGPGDKVRTPSPGFLDQVELPARVKLVTGR